MARFTGIARIIVCLIKEFYLTFIHINLRVFHYIQIYNNNKK